MTKSINLNVDENVFLIKGHKIWFLQKWMTPLYVRKLHTVIGFVWYKNLINYQWTTDNLILTNNIIV